MGRAKGVVLLPPSPLTCIIPCILPFPLSPVFQCHKEFPREERVTQWQFLLKTVFDTCPTHRLSVTLAEIFHSLLSRGSCQQYIDKIIHKKINKNNKHNGTMGRAKGVVLLPHHLLSSPYTQFFPLSPVSLGKGGKHSGGFC